MTSAVTSNDPAPWRGFTRYIETIRAADRRHD
jgi:hypothetical protein